MTTERRMREIVKYVSRQWGHGWPRLGETMQQALIRAEALAEIARQDRRCDDAAFHQFADDLATAAMRWEPQP